MSYQKKYDAYFQRSGGSRTHNLVPLVIGAVAAAPKVMAILDKVKPIAKALDKAKQVASKLGVGGVTQERFVERFKEVDKIFDNAGYEGQHPEKFYQQFQLGASQVENKKSSGNYYAEFQRLRKYIIARLNIYNPGLGDLYGKYFPDFPMADGGKSLGQMAGEPIKALAEIVKIAPGEYKEGMEVPSREQLRQITGQILPGTAYAPTESGSKNTGIAGGSILTQRPNDMPDIDDGTKQAGMELPSKNTLIILAVVIVVGYILLVYNKK